MAAKLDSLDALNANHIINFQVYLVGGAVRDLLLGIKIKDRDWVVVGATPQDLLAAGFHQVGRDFPVFLHPKTKEEYALARTERKTAPGHHGFVCDFSPNVTLQEDLMRRDLTINAMAVDQQGNITDPYNGYQDLQLRVLRHVSAAFIEDPLRVLRVARFSAQLGKYNFKVAEDTRILMTKISHNQELKQLSKERIWTELFKALSYDTGYLFLQGLESCDALKDLFPEQIISKSNYFNITNKFIELSNYSSTQYKVSYLRLGLIMLELNWDQYYVTKSIHHTIAIPAKVIKFLKNILELKKIYTQFKSSKSDDILNVYTKTSALKDQAGLRHALQVNAVHFSEFKYIDYWIGCAQKLSLLKAQDYIEENDSPAEIGKKIQQQKLQLIDNFKASIS